MTRLAGMRIVLVDDDADTIEAFRVVLRFAGAEVRCASTAANGLAEIERSPPDLLISDLAMPEVDGNYLIERVRHSERGGHLPAIALSAHAESAHEQRALGAGFDVYLTKPIDPVVLVDAIVDLTGWRGKP